MEYKNILKIGAKNKNNRIYDQETAEKMVSQFNETREKFGHFLGELGHGEICGITLSNVSHDVEELLIKDGFVVAKINIKNTDAGKTLKSIEDNFVYRTRGIGNVNEDGTIDSETYKLLSIDAISKDNDSYIGIM